LHRFWFNRTVDYLKQPDTKASLYSVRKIVQSGADIPDWAMDCPQRIREHAMSDACEAVKNAKRKSKQQKTPNFVAYQTKRDSAQRFGFDSVSLKENFVFGRENRIDFTASESFTVEMEGTRCKNDNRRWYLIVPNRVKIKQPETKRLHMVALDPGVRTFMAYYSPEMTGMLGNGDFNRIYRLCIALDRLIGKCAKAKARKAQRLKKAILRARFRIKNLVDDLHKKSAHFFATRFDVVLLPHFEVSKMVQRKIRKISNKSVRSMLTWSHYRFSQALKSTAEKYSCTVIEVNEAYTSKTCSYCGTIHDIGSKKEMKCCGTAFDRDLNGARGIMLRALRATALPNDKYYSACIC
jgi:putative transposase